MLVDLNEFVEHLKYFQRINDVYLKDITWTVGHKVLQATPEQIEEWKFIGLSNKEFPESVGWISDDSVVLPAASTAGDKPPSSEAGKEA